MDTERFVLKAYVHRANMLEQMGIRTLLCQADGPFPRISQLWLDVVGYDIRDLKFCYGGSCGPFAERPGGGPAVRYETTYEYVGRRRFDNADYRSDLKLIKNSQASADQGREGTCFFSYGIPYFVASNHRTIVALDSYDGAQYCTGTATAVRVDRPEVLDWVRTFL